MTDRFLSLTQAAQLLGVSERTVYRLMEAGELHPFKQGKFWKFDEADIEAYITRLREVAARKLQEKREANRSRVDQQEAA